MIAGANLVLKLIVHIHAPGWLVQCGMPGISANAVNDVLNVPSILVVSRDHRHKSRHRSQLNAEIQPAFIVKRLLRFFIGYSFHTQNISNFIGMREETCKPVKTEKKAADPVLTTCFLIV